MEEIIKERKKNYEKYAQELNEEKEQLQDLYEITHGVKPKKPKELFVFSFKKKLKIMKLNLYLKDMNYGNN